MKTSRTWQMVAGIAFAVAFVCVVITAVLAFNSHSTGQGWLYVVLAILLASAPPHHSSGYTG